MKKTDWSVPLREHLPQNYFERMLEFINSVYADGAKIYPPEEKIFRAIELTSLSETKVIIVGQDPYPQPQKAQGLSFSYPDQFKVTRPDSMSNIQKELQNEGFDKKSTDLTAWAKQGVLLLNAVLTVPEFQSNAHAGKIWEPLTDSLITIASEDDRPKVFLLWGGFARKKAALIDPKKHLILEAPHPSPLSATRGFFGCDHFLKTNTYLNSTGQSPIDWSK
ncbi:uracil-DNA glycosylase [Lactococcus hircilactis]|uniref:Uracil-DNA glycosylase n=1 Tax=Lactococcus hircilactis TaxID=1494462 RepID=A0A7X1ZA53_9LACT|nr:uracil-DNA glycosylase [Lactococcus hircilactis]MQW39512.1 uracil-DNA glycosylase [Lactococcus hircilactis]